MYTFVFFPIHHTASTTFSAFTQFFLSFFFVCLFVLYLSFIFVVVVVVEAVVVVPSSVHRKRFPLT